MCCDAPYTTHRHRRVPTRASTTTHAHSAAWLAPAAMAYAMNSGDCVRASSFATQSDTWKRLRSPSPADAAVGTAATTRDGSDASSGESLPSCTHTHPRTAHARVHVRPVNDAHSRHATRARTRRSTRRHAVRRHAHARRRAKPQQPTTGGADIQYHHRTVPSRTRHSDTRGQQRQQEVLALTDTTPERPSSTLRHTVSRHMPSGDTTPMPVTTTRRAARDRGAAARRDALMPQRSGPACVAVRTGPARGAQRVTMSTGAPRIDYSDKYADLYFEYRCVSASSCA